ncbi:MAG: site-specific DNA-methyltransferase, partial [Sporomusaceae bacterium]|nr:site-specific DNA-methyltransferase [Sporomusaceae bacterium]
KEIVEDEYPDEIEPRCKAGQIWTLGNHRLMCGDSTDPTAVDALTAGQKVKLFYTDPPYNVNYEGANGLKIKNDDMDSRLFLEFLTKAFKNADGVMEPGAAFYIWHADTAVEFRNACLEIGWPLRQCLIWHKNHFIMGRQDYQWKHEPCLYGWKGGAAHYFTEDRTNPTVIAAMRPEFAKMKKDELVSLLERLFGPETPGTIIDCEKPTKNEEHPTMKPIKLIAPMIQNSSKLNWPVLDLFGGSGSTLIACEQLGRKCFMMELDPKYCDVIIQRWENLTGQTAVLEA